MSIGFNYSILREKEYGGIQTKKRRECVFEQYSEPAPTITLVGGWRGISEGFARLAGAYGEAGWKARVSAKRHIPQQKGGKLT
ncbi:MAG: hypothetical protein CEN90_140 [Parcubacteria group bacterium Licking1014_17]|nr:MAG: hypothetical protein CEN90_140 [Parcubacteria group bacterium Licking1014_17]